VNHIGVIELPECPDLAKEPRPDARVTAPIGPNDFHSRAAAEDAVTGQKYVPHSAFADPIDEDVGTESQAVPLTFNEPPPLKRREPPPPNEFDRQFGLGREPRPNAVDVRAALGDELVQLIE